MITIRAEQPDDMDAIRAINDSAFGQPTEAASMSIQEKHPGKNIEERLARLAGVPASEQPLHLCREVG